MLLDTMCFCSLLHLVCEEQCQVHCLPLCTQAAGRKG